MNKDRRLGRGLAALLGTPTEERESEASSVPVQHIPDPAPMATPEEVGDIHGPSDEPPPDDESTTDLVNLNVYEIDDNPFQPRREFNEPEIASLAESLKEHDMLQPILVRNLGDRFQLISGERRLRAAIRAGWSTVPARIRDADDRLVAELAIVENLQRKDLNPIEKALSFKRYLEEHGCKQEDLARRLKIDRSTIANLMRLLELPEQVLEAVRTGLISAGHARALLPLGDDDEQVKFCHQISEAGISVRETERQVQQRIAESDDGSSSLPNSEDSGRPKGSAQSDQVACLEQELRTALGTRIEIRQSSRGRGRIVIHFANHEEFERIRGTLTATDSSTRREAA